MGRNSKGLKAIIAEDKGFTQKHKYFQPFVIQNFSVVRKKLLSSFLLWMLNVVTIHFATFIPSNFETRCLMNRVARLGILSQDLGIFLFLWDFSWDLIFPKISKELVETEVKSSRSLPCSNTFHIFIGIAQGRLRWGATPSVLIHGVAGEARIALHTELFPSLLFSERAFPGIVDSSVHKNFCPHIYIVLLGEV